MPETLPRLIISGSQLKTKSGKSVLLRGVNIVSKTSQTPEQLGFDDHNAEFLKDHGFTVVRLGLLWSSIQPYPSKNRIEELYDLKYLASIQRTIRLLAKYNIYTLLDFHQDAYAPLWGDGAPYWAVSIGGQNQLSVGFPYNIFGGSPVQTDVIFAIDAFWQDTLIIDGLSVQTHYLNMIQFVANYFRNEKGNILGYDPMNEPTPGSLWIEAKNIEDPTDFSKGTPTFDAILSLFYQKAIQKIRLGDPKSNIWYEPNGLFGLGAQTYLPKFNFNNIGFNFHNYDGPNFLSPILNARLYQKMADVPLLCSEFGATTDATRVKLLMKLNDEYQLSAIYWTYFNNPQYAISNTKGQLPEHSQDQGLIVNMTKPLQAPNLLKDVMHALTQPYPLFISGTLISFSFHDTIFRLKYIAIYGITTIIIPSLLYPHGYCIKINNGKLISQTDTKLKILGYPGIIKLVFKPKHIL